MQASPTVVFDADYLTFTDRHGATLVVRGKWFTLYRELFLGEAGSLTRASVAELPGWSAKDDDIGREIARHLRRSKACQLDPPPLLSRNPTIRWERNPLWAAAVSHEGRNTDVFDMGRREWMPALGAGTELSTIRWAALQVTALLAFMEGALKPALDKALEAAAEAHCSELRVISQLLALRAAWRLDPDDALLDVIEDLEDAISSLEPGVEIGPLRQAILARLAAFKTLHATANEWPAAIRALGQRLASRTTHGDLMTDALTANYLAITKRRTGDPAAAFCIIAKALAASVASNEIHLIQSVLFNCGHIMLTLAARTGEEQLVDPALCMLELVSTITDRHNIGGDSAQNELLIAHHKISKCKLDDAERMLSRASKLVERSGNVYDQACLGEIDLRLRCAREANFAQTSSFRRRLDEVADLYMAANRQDLVTQMRLGFETPSAPPRK